MGLVDRRPVVCRNLAMGFWVPLQYPNINTKGNSMLFGVAHINFLRRSTRVRTLNRTFLPPLMGCAFSIVTA